MQLFDNATELAAFVLFGVVFFVVLAFMKSLKPKQFPPGPSGLPFIGNGNYVVHNKKLHHTYSQLSRDYGPIVGLQLGWYPTVILSDYKLIRKAFDRQPDVFSKRANHLAFIQLIGLDSGVVNSNGQTWMHNRSLSLVSLKNFGLGKSSMEHVLHDETQVLLNFISERAESGKAFHLDKTFQKITSNIMCSLLFGERFPHNSTEFEALLHDIDTLTSNFGIQIGMFALVPYLIPTALFKLSIINTFLKWRHIQYFLKRKINEHSSTFDQNNIRDFLDVYIEAEYKEQHLKVKEGVPWYRSLLNYVISGVDVKERSLFLTILDLFIAGSETVATTLKWGLLYFIHYPRVQEKCRQEIMQKIGNRTPCFTDRQLLPYVEATISEIQRMSSSVPHGGMHCTSTGVDFEGYHLPANTIVIPDYYSVHRDPNVWTDPHVFRPERFLDSNGKAFKPPYFMPFSTGRRACFGDNMARLELFLFLTSMLQRFSFSCDTNDPLPSIDGGICLEPVLNPDAFRIIATPC